MMIQWVQKWRCKANAIFNFYSRPKKGVWIWDIPYDIPPFIAIRNREHVFFEPVDFSIWDFAFVCHDDLLRDFQETSQERDFCAAGLSWMMIFNGNNIWEIRLYIWDVPSKPPLKKGSFMIVPYFVEDWCGKPLKINEISKITIHGWWQSFVSNGRLMRGFLTPARYPRFEKNCWCRSVVVRLSL